MAVCICTLHFRPKQECMSTLKTIADKTAALKSRKDAERALGAQIDRTLAQADVERPGCGLCHIWRRMTGSQRSAALVAVVESSSGTAANAVGKVQTHSRIFGVRKSDPHSALALAAESMNSRILQLESRAASEREEAKKQMQLGQKPSALRLLKRAKATEKQLEANQASLMAIEQQVDLMAQAQMQKQLASALASSSKGMKAQKKLLKHAESAVDDAQDARDMADDLGNVMAEFAQNGNGNEDEDELLDELNSMMTEGPRPPASDLNVAVQELSPEEKAAEIARLEARIARYDESLAVRDAVAAMPAVPATKANGKSKMTQGQMEKERLLAPPGLQMQM